jgi:alpha-beta hydrolase superfamily lysophospholipase
MPVKQIQYYRDHQGTPMFFSMHPAVESRETGTAVLMAPAIFEEKQDAHRAMVNFANRMAEQGITVLRFDYRGQGESAGELHHFRPGDLIEDIRFAYAELQRSGNFSQTGAIGVRFGANLLAAAAADTKFAFWIGWAPVYDGENYAKTVLWTNLTTQMMVHRKIIEDRKVLLKKLEDGDLVDVDGYKLSHDWYRYLCEDDLARHLAESAIPALMLDITADPEQENSRWEQFMSSLSKTEENRASGERIKGDTFWRLTPLYAVRPKATFERSEEFILGHVSR